MPLTMHTIGKLAPQADLGANALRFHERAGLIQPAPKSDSGYRLYDALALSRVRFIEHAQQCGFTTEIYCPILGAMEQVEQAGKT
ncbi:MAG: MerR family DNA-binding transcriptional regulator [Pseudomonadota bacterium]|nr:MerR family DNA-binding transcriptional regulator [Pseudomonadota bacterium]